MDAERKSEQSIRPWKSALDGIRHLANQQLHHRGIGRIEVSFEDLEQKERHVFHVMEPAQVYTQWQIWRDCREATRRSASRRTKSIGRQP